MRQDRTIAAALIPEAGEKEPLYELIELLFFAYRDFVGDPDRLLETFVSAIRSLNYRTRS